MNVEYLIQLLENKIIFLTNSKAQAFMIGDLATINSVETEMSGINDTLYKLRLLLAATQAAAGANTDISSMITAGVEAIQSTPIILDNATECMSLYDISTYATDPLHERKIASILESMGLMESVVQIDAYIDTKAISSPLTGQMILDAAEKYNVDCRLAMAIMELDSRFGTAGVAVDTFNPGNVGNTGSETKTYGSWDDGVDAVFAWLNRHRGITVVEPVVETPIVEAPPIETPLVETPPAEAQPTETPIVDALPVEDSPVETLPVIEDVSTTAATSTPALPEILVADSTTTSSTEAIE